MNIAPNCYLCIYNQTFNLTKRLKLNEKEASEILREVAKILSKYDLNVSPPEIAKEVYAFISNKLNIDDPFLVEKQKAIKEALKLKPLFLEKIKQQKDSLFEAIKIAVYGNVIDLGVLQNYELNSNIEIQFFKNDYGLFKRKLFKAKNIVYLADNAGENIFDEILIRELKKYVDEIYYFVRGKPVINDITIKDLEGLEINKLAKIIDTSVATPGFCIKEANEYSKELFYDADLVISKGMGNFECLSDIDREVFFLFKVKCEVVAKAVNAKLNDYMFIKN